MLWHSLECRCCKLQVLDDAGALDLFPACDSNRNPRIADTRQTLTRGYGTRPQTPDPVSILFEQSTRIPSLRVSECPKTSEYMFKCLKTSRKVGDFVVAQQILCLESRFLRGQETPDSSFKIFLFCQKDQIFRCGPADFSQGQVSPGDRGLQQPAHSQKARCEELSGGFQK